MSRVCAKSGSCLFVLPGRSQENFIACIYNQYFYFYFTEINAIRSSSVRKYGVVVKCQSHERLATENRPGQIILRNLVARLPESCQIARILPDCQNLAGLPTLCIGS